ncbi:hypothetical protein PR202_gb29529 [Eleusine coracana subsp. coracana]|uniref:Uncharacterized protein n=1 Tax=Eleusine coracana subsp. coracana TaxID=191504 RepID=A0AAV5G093_ELECO|nr:hypothetical protein PR202_gb29528 [Eleusine coracana subsp. coracana]GJN40325.1 hypothetical protein PR202_gb29529 [Eleusine coracana subsp. coracana]
MRAEASAVQAFLQSRTWGGRGQRQRTDAGSGSGSVLTEEDGMAQGACVGRGSTRAPGVAAGQELPIRTCSSSDSHQSPLCYLLRNQGGRRAKWA